MRIRHERRGVRIDAPAKLNLFLELLGKRPDGFHELETLMATVDLYDSLFFREESAEEVRLHCRDAGTRLTNGTRESIPTDEGNLVVRAASLLKQHANVTRGVSITLIKRIPAAAGLAGGSSDAAATLAALNFLWGLNLPMCELQELAATLGSDIPFFLGESALAVCRGRGEIIEPLRFPVSLFAVIVQPPAGLSTAAVYARCRIPESPKSVQPLLSALRSGELGKLARCLHNALEAPALELCPELREITDYFNTEKDIAHQMSGSGSAYFGLCRQSHQAYRLARRLKARRLGTVHVARIGP